MKETKRAKGGWILGGLMGVVLGAVSHRAAAALPSFDFRDERDAAGWSALHDLAPLARTPDGLVAVITGSDPYFAGPARDYPDGMPLWLRLRLRSETGGTCQVFYFRSGTVPTEPDSVRFPVRAGEWVTARVPTPALGSGVRLRVDPPGETGTCVFGELGFEPRILHEAPPWPGPETPVLRNGDPIVASGTLRLIHSREQWSAFQLEVDGRRVAMGYLNPLLGYLVEGRPRWWNYTAGARPTVVRGGDGSIEVRLEARDLEGGLWRFRQAFAPGREPGTLSVRSALSVDQPRLLLHYAPLVLVAGKETTGERKGQALLAGVEYLEDEPSSSEADLVGPQARRQVVDTDKLTFPLAAVVLEGRYLGLTWDMRPEVAVLFDSPDRVFRSGGHVLGLLVPGSDGLLRDEGSLVPYDPLVLAADTLLEVRAEILGGRGATVIPAIQHYVRLRGWPDVPATGYTAGAFFRLAARGWLDSRIREGDRYRHAVPGPFEPGPAADAAWMMTWLAGRVDDGAMARRLEGASRSALAQVPSRRWAQSGVGHVRPPVAPLVFGAVRENVESVAEQGRGLLGRFDGPGTVRYQARSDALDYGRTHWTNEANGLTAQVVVSVLEAAAFSGDRALREAGLEHLRALEKFRGTVPRGAQTWEIALHTPDILAAGYLVRAYTLGFELSGDSAFLDQARYWAWTGVPFVYLRQAGPGPVGVYATTPVLGATQWVAPNWIGLPVQWCGLVYGDALYGLARHDPAGPWKRLADGIAASGIQQTYPESDPNYRGLLPDSYSLKPQQRNPANINPATLLVSAVRHLGVGPLYDAWTFRRHGARAHVAGEIRGAQEDEGGFEFQAAGWPRGIHRVLIAGLTGRERPEVSVEGRPTPLTPPHEWDEGLGLLVLEVEGSSRIVVRTGR